MFLTLFSRQANPVAVLCTLIKKLNISVTPRTVKKDLEDHPDYPSLLALSDCLIGWKVPHETYRINKNEYNHEVLSFPFIAHLTKNSGQFIFVDGIKDGRVRYSNEQGKDNILTEAEFLKNWDGIILYAEKDEQSGEAAYSSNLVKGWLNQARLPILVLMLSCCIFNVLIHTEHIALPYLGLLGLKLAGIIVSTLLLVNSIDTYNPFIQNLCGLGKRNDCNAILKSDAAKITNWLSWSEVGMFYFSGSFITLLLNPDAINLLGWFSITCLPYTLYSIGYQVKLKKWCILCCTVQGLLWLEAITFLFNYKLQLLLPVLLRFNILSLIISFLLPVAIWSYIKPFMINAQQSGPLKQQLKKFKYNSVLFNQLLSTQTRYSVPDNLAPVLLGNPEAGIVITIVSNLFCRPCAAAHKTLNDWMSSRDDIALKIVFATAGYGDQQAKVAGHIIALNLLGDTSIVEKAIEDWYEHANWNYETWAESYPVGFNAEVEDIIRNQKDWCDKTEVTFTPTIFINGYKLVEPYILDDIRYLLN